MFDGLSILQTNVTIGRQWMLQMAEGVKQNGVTMQQCTAYPRHTLMGLEIPVVTQVHKHIKLSSLFHIQLYVIKVFASNFTSLYINFQQRVTIDYALKDSNWRTGINSLWVYSLGQVPYKDIFWTTPDQHCPKYPSKDIYSITIVLI